MAETITCFYSLTQMNLPFLFQQAKNESLIGVLTVSDAGHLPRDSISDVKLNSYTV